jgi:hypothetical protein
MPLSKLLVERADAHAFDATQLLDTAARRRWFAEADLEHLANDLEAGLFIQGQACLIQEAIGPRTTRLAGGIETDSGFPNPNEQGAARLASATAA